MEKLNLSILIIKPISLLKTKLGLLKSENDRHKVSKSLEPSTRNKKHEIAPVCRSVGVSPLGICFLFNSITMVMTVSNIIAAAAVCRLQPVYHVWGKTPLAVDMTEWYLLP